VTQRVTSFGEVSERRWAALRRHGLALLALTIVGFAVRWPFRHEPGFAIDINLYVAWCETAANQGLAALYAREDFNYPPLASYLFLVLGHLQRDLLGGPFRVDDPSMLALLKLPAILCDLVLAGVLYLFLARRASSLVAVGGALAYALNPAVIYDSVIWGQWDALLALPLVLSLVCLIGGRPHLAASLLAVALLTKFQAVVLLPLLFVVVLRRRGWRGLLTAGLAGAATAAVLLVPVVVKGQVREVVAIYVGLSGSQPWVSDNAWNLWWLVNWLQSGNPNMTLKDWQPLLGPLRYKDVALGLYVLVALWISVALYRSRLTVETLSLSASALVLAFFALAPEMHERYLFPAIPLLILGFAARPQLVLYALLSLTLYLNLRWVYLAARDVPWSVAKLAATALFSFVNLAALAWFCAALYARTDAHLRNVRRAWLAATAAALAVGVLAGVVVLRWYVRDVR
jgi:Gpi18-like mannosyltransferase